MRRIWIVWFLGILIMPFAKGQYSSERTGYDGDFFSLEGALDVFKNSRTLRSFERKINGRDSWVNNLDLDYDGKIDYVRVEHRRKGDFHAIIMQVALGRRELQDIAVIEIEQTGRRDALLQVIGDPDIYGEEIIIEPVEAISYSSNYSRRNRRYGGTQDYVNVYYWPAVQHILDRGYRVYASPYRWNYYPTWWSPWRPYAWNVFRPRIVNYYSSCRIINVYRTPRAHRFYRPYRSNNRFIVDRTTKIRRKRGTAHIRTQRQHLHRSARNGKAYTHGTRIDQRRNTTTGRSFDRRGIDRSNNSDNRSSRIYRESPKRQERRSPQVRKHGAVHKPAGRHSNTKEMRKAPTQRHTPSRLKQRPSSKRDQVRRSSPTPPRKRVTPAHRSTSPRTKPAPQRKPQANATKSQVRKKTGAQSKNKFTRKK